VVKIFASLFCFFLADQNVNAFKEVAIIRHPRIGEYAIAFITSTLTLQVTMPLPPPPPPPLLCPPPFPVLPGTNNLIIQLCSILGKPTPLYDFLPGPGACSSWGTPWEPLGVVGMKGKFCIKLSFVLRGVGNECVE